MSQTADHPAATFPSDEPAAGDDSPDLPDARLALPWMATWTILLCASAAVAAGLVAGSHGAHGFFLPVLAAAVCVLAGLFDAWTGRIPNPLTYTAILLGLGLNAILPALVWMKWGAAVTWLAAVGPSSSLLGFAACAGLGLLATLLAGVHGGDLKLLAAVGSILGLTQTGNVLIVALAVAMIYALINLAVVGRLNTVFRIGAARLLELIYLRRFVTHVPEDSPTAATHIPMAVPLAIGLLIAQYWQWRTGGFVL